MTKALRYLVRNSPTYFHRPGAVHIKVGLYNFYPTTGRIHRDNDPVCLPERGLAAFTNALGLPAPGSPRDGERDRQLRAARVAQSKTQPVDR
ncbi:hypothetical protein [Methylobacterium sp. SyP6R]|uniref:hypothetical protein n=1 Tax=Methylobacterium sp. SyP6R TaxID=2718876 RepID=UPI001F1BA734|nr:hypothetical protein [Methylobacterium sp. SyP6R]MCF4124482.1 hypothetical protein [Methylobacterium sp. SyP6R]